MCTFIPSVPAKPLKLICTGAGPRIKISFIKGADVQPSRLIRMWGLNMQPEFEYSTLNTSDLQSYIHTYTHKRTYVHTYIHTYIHTHTNTHIYIYTYIHLQVFVLRKDMFLVYAGTSMNIRIHTLHHWLFLPLRWRRCRLCPWSCPCNYWPSCEGVCMPCIRLKGSLAWTYRSRYKHPCTHMHCIFLWKRMAHQSV